MAGALEEARLAVHAQVGDALELVGGRPLRVEAAVHQQAHQVALGARARRLVARRLEDGAHGDDGLHGAALRAAVAPLRLPLQLARLPHQLAPRHAVVAVARPVAQVAAHQVRVRVVHDLPRIQDVVRVPQVLYLVEHAVELGAELHLEELRAAEPVAVLAADGAAEAQEQLVGLHGDLLHLLAVLGDRQVEVGPRVQHARAGVAVGGVLDAVLREDALLALQVLAEAARVHRGVLDEAHRVQVLVLAVNERLGALADRPERLDSLVVEGDVGARRGPVGRCAPAAQRRTCSSTAAISCPSNSAISTAPVSGGR